MLAADRAIVACDPALALSVVLDDDALTALLRRRWPGDQPAPDRVRVTYLRYKPGVSVVATVALAWPHREDLAALMAGTTRSGAKLAKAAALAARRPGSLPAVHDEATRLLVVPLSADRHLPGVGRLRRGLRDIDRSFRRATVVPMTYKPHRRIVARIDVEAQPRAVLRLYEPDGYAAASRALAWATAQRIPTVQLPRSLAEDGRHCALVAHWVHGTPLDRLDESLINDGLRVAGATVAALHRRDPSGLDVASLRQPSDEQVLAAIETVLPQARPIAQSALGAAETRQQDRASPTSMSPLVPIHGDLRPEHVVAGSPGGILDLDRAGVGRAEEDLASWAAARLSGDRSDGWPFGPSSGRPDLDALLSTQFLDAYLEAGGPATREGVLRELPRAILRQSVGSFRTRDPDWPRRMDGLVQAAARFAAVSSS